MGKEALQNNLSTAGGLRKIERKGGKIFAHLKKRLRYDWTHLAPGKPAPKDVQQRFQASQKPLNYPLQQVRSWSSRMICDALAARLFRAAPEGAGSV